MVNKSFGVTINEDVIKIADKTVDNSKGKYRNRNHYIEYAIRLLNDKEKCQQK